MISISWFCAKSDIAVLTILGIVNPLKTILKKLSFDNFAISKVPELWLPGILISLSGKFWTIQFIQLASISF